MSIHHNLATIDNEIISVLNITFQFNANCLSSHFGITNDIFFKKKNRPSPASFSLFLSFQYTVDSKQMFNRNK